MVDGVARDDLAEREIGAVVTREGRLDGHDAPVAAHAQARPVTLAAIRGAAEEVLPPRLRPPERTSEPSRRRGEDDVLGVGVALDAEAAARVRTDDPHALLGEIEGGRDGAAEPIRRLARDPDGEPAVGSLRHHHQPAGLQRRAHNARQVQLRLHHHLGLGQRGARLAHLRGGRPGDIVRPLGEHPRRARRARGGEPRRYRERRVVHRDRLRGIGGEVGRLGEHHRDDLAGMTDHRVRKDGLRRAAEGGG